MKNVITLGKLMRLLLFCLPLLVLSINMRTKTTRNALARLVRGTIFLVIYTKAVCRMFILIIYTKAVCFNILYIIDTKAI